MVMLLDVVMHSQTSTVRGAVLVFDSYIQQSESLCAAYVVMLDPSRILLNTMASSHCDERSRRDGERR